MLLKTVTQASSSFSSELCIHVSNGNMRSMLIFVAPPLRENFGPADFFSPNKMPKYVFTIKNTLMVIAQKILSCAISESNQRNGA